MDDPRAPIPPRVKVTTAWLAEQDAKQAAYQARRRQATGLARLPAPAAPPRLPSGRETRRRTVADPASSGWSWPGIARSPTAAPTETS